MQSLAAVNFPGGQGGLNRMKNMQLLPPTDLTWVDGITAEILTWQKEGGAVKLFGSSLGTSVQSLWDFFSAAFVQETVAALGDGRLVTLDANGIVKTIATLTGAVNRFGWFVEGFSQEGVKALFYFDGYSVPQVYMGDAATSNILSTSADWVDHQQPHMAFLHRFRMIAMGGSNNHTLYLSSPRDHRQFSDRVGDSTILSVYPGEGQRLMGGISFRKKAYVAKYPRGIYFIDDSSTNIQEWQILPVTPAIGIAGPGCWCPNENDVVILDTEGYFHNMSAIRTFDQEEIPPAFSIEVSDFLRAQINLTRLDLVRSRYYGRNKQMVWCLPGNGATVNNRKLIIDYNIPERPRLFWSTRDECVSITTRRNNHIEELIIGDSQGSVWRLDQETKSKDGQGYRSQFEYGSYPILEKGVQSANLRELQVIFAPAGDWDVTYEIHTDGVLSQVVHVSQQTSGGAVGSLTLDADVLAGATIQNDRQRLIGECNYVKILGFNDQAGQDFNVVDHIIRYKPGRF